MQLSVILGFLAAMICICAHYTTKVIDWIQRHKFLKYQNQSAEFISDLYKIKMKWAKRGEFAYCKAIEAVIGAEMMDDVDKVPQTEEGRLYIEKIKELMQEEVRKNGDLFN